MLRRAFTLIELLVTIGVITLLASLAMPGIKSVRESSQSSECATRLRQLSTAAQSYSNVFRGVFPPAILFEMTSSGVRTVAWDFAQGANGEVRPGPLCLSRITHFRFINAQLLSARALSARIHIRALITTRHSSVQRARGRSWEMMVEY